MFCWAEYASSAARAARAYSLLLSLEHFVGVRVLFARFVVSTFVGNMEAIAVFVSGETYHL